MATLILDRSSAQTLIAFGTETLSLDGRDDAWVAKMRDFLHGRIPDALTVGLGPGSFAGIRAAIACLQGMGIGWGLQPRGFTSAAALALASGRKNVTVIGDARRGTLWSVTFTVTDDYIVQNTPFEILSAATFIPDATMISPDAKRLERFGLPEVTLSAELLPETLRRLGATALTDDPLPIYLHPAVGCAKVL